MLLVTERHAQHFLQSVPDGDKDGEEYKDGF